MLSRTRTRLGPLRLSLVLLAMLPATASCRRETQSGEVRRAAMPRNVLLITVDTLRADTLGFAGHRLVKTPTLDRLAATGRTFDAAHAHCVTTLPSHASMLTGLYPFQHGVRHNGGFVLPENVATLTTRLQADGFRTAAFVGAFPLMPVLAWIVVLMSTTTTMASKRVVKGSFRTPNEQATRWWSARYPGGSPKLGAGAFSGCICSIRTRPTPLPSLSNHSSRTTPISAKCPRWTSS